MKISIQSFHFKPIGYGHYSVTYTSPAGRVHNCTTTDMPLIDATKNSDAPFKKDLEQLKRLCTRATKISKTYK